MTRGIDKSVRGHQGGSTDWFVKATQFFSSPTTDQNKISTCDSVEILYKMLTSLGYYSGTTYDSYHGNQ